MQEQDDVTVAPGESRNVAYLDDVANRMLAVVPRESSPADLIGIVLEGGTHVAIPAYITAEEAGGRPLHAFAGNEQVDATFVGSDKHTNVTVLKLAKPYGKAMPFADAKPALKNTAA